MRIDYIMGLVDGFGTDAKDYGVALATNPPGSPENEPVRQRFLASRERVKQALERESHAESASRE